MEQSGSHDNLPLGIMRGVTSRPAHHRAVRMNLPGPHAAPGLHDLPSHVGDASDTVAHLPSRVSDAEMSLSGGVRVPVRRRTWTHNRSTAANIVVQNLPSHRGCCYMPDPTEESLNHLHHSLSKVNSSIRPGDTVVLCGDFNLPNIRWKRGANSLVLPERAVDGPGEGVEAAVAQSRDTGASLDEQAAHIVTEMERDATFMEDNPQAEQLRKDTLKEMPEPLALKRTIRRKLSKTVSQKSKHSPIGVWKRFKYRTSMALSKMSLTVQTLLYSFELWYQSMKVIEGHFGSGVATYFKFLRWLFLLNMLFCVNCVFFIVLPQLLYNPREPVDVNLTDSSANIRYQLFDLDGNSSDSVGITAIPMSTDRTRDDITRSEQEEAGDDFSFSDIFTGEGYFTDSTLYYGYYVNDTLHESTGSWYSIPNAYFFTTVALYVFMFIVLSISMARSYRRSFIETAGGVKNVYAHKVFCGWDFSIASGESARLRSKTIYNELKELLGDDAIKRERLSLNARCHMLTIKVSISVFCVLLLAATAVLMWLLLDSSTAPLVVSFIITLIMILAPMLFSWLSTYEGYRSPRTVLYVTLLRTFALEVVIVAVLVSFWLTQDVDNVKCWETSLGQEVYRLVLMDFWFSILGTALAEFLRARLSKSIWVDLGTPEFDIARNTLNLIYNQTLFWVGAFFSPLLPVIIVIKMAVTFYVKKLSVLHNCEPSSRSWRAAQTHTMFLVLTFLSLLGVISTLGYILSQVAPSEQCGPFRNLAYIYEIILTGVFQLGDGSSLRKLILYLTRPGVVGGILLAMGVCAYYLRAQSRARRAVVEILREMLKLEAKDKEFLLSNISKVTGGEWMYSLGPEGMRGRPTPAAGDQPDEWIQGGQQNSPTPHPGRGRHSNLDQSSSSGVSPGGRCSGPPHRLSGGVPSPKRVSLSHRYSGRLSPTLRMSADGDHVVLGHVPGRFGNPASVARMRSPHASHVSSSSSDETQHFSGPDDEILQLSDEELNQYESTRVRSLRRKHMNKF